MTKRIGIIGCGGMGRSHVKFFRQAGADVVAAADISAAAREQMRESTGVTAYASSSEMLESARPDAVVVCTPPSSRVAVIRECLARSIPILCEKPLAHNVSDSEELAKRGRDSGVPCRLCFTHRYVPAVQVMKRRIAAGDIGRVTSFRNAFGGYAPTMSTQWGSDPAMSGGGILIDSGPHSVDLFAHLCGIPDETTVEAHLRCSWPGRGEDSASVMLHTREGTFGYIHLSWLFPYPRVELEIIGENGGFYLDYERPLELRVRSRTGEWVVEPVASANSRFVLQDEAFLRVLEGETTELGGFEDGLLVDRLIESAYANAHRITN